MNRDSIVVPVTTENASIDTEPAASAAYRRGLLEGGAIVFKAVMEHESNTGRGVALFQQLQQVAEDALAQPIIVDDPDEQPLWEHLIKEAFYAFEARTSGTAPFTFPEDVQHAFKKAVREMLGKKLPAPDSENMRLREALARIHHARTGERAEPTVPLNQLLAVAGTPAAHWRETEKADPHGNRFECARAQLALGHLSDDELANEVFLNGDRKLTGRDLMAGVLPAIAYLQAGKDRIRWLSRALVRTQVALRTLYEETADYIRLNNLGDVHHNRSMQMARDALRDGATPSPGDPGEMRATFYAWVHEQGCDSDGAWSAWQGCWDLFTSAGMGTHGDKA